MSEKKYSLETIRQAWGAGKHSGRRTKETRWVIAQKGRFSGVVISETDEMVECELCDAFMVVGMGTLDFLSGEIKRFPREECEIFKDKEAAIRSLGRYLAEAKAKGWA